MRALVVFTLVLPTLVLPAPALADCAAIELALAGVASDVRCVASPDLTTRNADTTPPDNSRPGLPPNAFTPRTDAQAVSADAPFRTTIDPDRTFPGLQITGAMIDDANARWVLRLPTNWNGRLVVGVPGGGCCRSSLRASTAVWTGRVSTGRPAGRTSSSTYRSRFATGSRTSPRGSADRAQRFRRCSTPATRPTSSPGRRRPATPSAPSSAPTGRPTPTTTGT